MNDLLEKNSNLTRKQVRKTRVKTILNELRTINILADDDILRWLLTYIKKAFS